MKKYLLLLLALPLFLGCSNDFNNTNKFLPSYSFTYTLDLGLPSNANLSYTGNPVRISTDGIGINGIIVMNVGGSYVAWEDSCPNQALATCSKLTVNGINAKCPCAGEEYSLFTGQPTTSQPYSLKAYRVEVMSSSVIRVYN